MEKHDDSDVKATDRFKKLEKERVEALHRSNALKYFTLCNDEGVCPEDEDLYALGAAEYDNRLAKTKEREKEQRQRESELVEKTELDDDETKGIKCVCNFVKEEIKNKRNVKGRISCHSGGFTQGVGYVTYFTYDFNGKKHEDMVVDDEREIKTEESLDIALKNLVYFLNPFPVRKIGAEGNSYSVQIGNFKEKKDDAYEIFRKEAPYVANVPQMRQLLVKCWPNQYGPEKKTDLGWGVRPPWIIEAIFRRKGEKLGEKLREKD